MVVYLTTKTIQIKPYTIRSSHQLGLEVERPERSTTFSFFAILHDKRTIYSTKTIWIKQYTICSSHQLGLEVERPERSTTISFFRYFSR